MSNSFLGKKQIEKGDYQNLKVSGEYVAFRDQHIHHTIYSNGRLGFAPLIALERESQEYIPPIFTKELQRQLKDTQLLILGGGATFDKGALARYLAHSVTEQDNNYIVKEWLSSKDGQTAFSDIQNEKPGAVLLLNQIGPNNVNYDLDKLQKLGEKKNFYIVVTTDLPVHSWKLSQDKADEFWYEIPDDNLYDTDTIGAYIVKTINGLKDVFELDNQISTYDEFGGLFIHNIQDMLKTPENVDAFFKRLSNTEEPLQQVEALLNDYVAASRKDMMTQWFTNLSDNHKNIVIGLLLFDGLYDDQFFAAMEFVFKENWRSLINKNVTLDYCDVEDLLIFYRYEVVNEQYVSLRSKFPDQRQQLIDVIWTTHRRTILRVLPTLVKLIKLSNENARFNWELFGTQSRKDRLIEVMSDTLGTISRKSPKHIEATLVELAAGNFSSRLVAAKTLAGFRENDLEEELFDLLRNWQRETVVNQLFGISNRENSVDDSRKKEKSKKKDRKKIDESNPYLGHIRETLSMCLGYAAQYDPPNHLSQGILDVLVKLIQQKEKVFIGLRQVGIPMIVANHFHQLKQLLFRLADRNDLKYAIAVGLARGYETNPNQLKTLIGEWIDYSFNYSASEKGSSKRDNILTTLIFTLGEIRYNPTNHFDSDSGFEFLNRIYRNELSEKFRSYFFFAISRQIEYGFNDESHHLSDLLNTLKPNLSEQQNVALQILQYLKKDVNDLQQYGSALLLPVEYKEVNKVKSTSTRSILYSWIQEGSTTQRQIAFYALQQAIFGKSVEEWIRGRSHHLNYNNQKQATYSLSNRRIRRLKRKGVPATILGKLKVLKSKKFNTSYRITNTSLKLLVNGGVHSELILILKRLLNCHYKTRKALLKSIYQEAILHVLDDQTITFGRSARRTVSKLFSDDITQIVEVATFTGKAKFIRNIQKLLDEEESKEYLDLVIHTVNGLERDHRKASNLKLLWIDRFAHFLASSWGQRDEGSLGDRRPLFDIVNRMKFGDRELMILWKEMTARSVDMKNLITDYIKLHVSFKVFRTVLGALIAIFLTICLIMTIL